MPRTVCQTPHRGECLCGETSAGRTRMTFMVGWPHCLGQTTFMERPLSGDYAGDEKDNLVCCRFDLDPQRRRLRKMPRVVRSQSSHGRPDVRPHGGPLCRHLCPDLLRACLLPASLRPLLLGNLDVSGLLRLRERCNDGPRRRRLRLRAVSQVLDSDCLPRESLRGFPRRSTACRLYPLVPGTLSAHD